MTAERTPQPHEDEKREGSNALRVREFHEAIGESPPRTPSYPDEDLLALRRKLIEEEHSEVMEALDRLEGAAPEELERSFVAVAHELVDLLYVTYGALVWFGIDADAVFAEVHSANMRKSSGPKRADGKQLKPPGWRPADVAAVIERARGDRRARPARAEAEEGTGD
jgi:predicted HAD superfamily Cof-like phosphohydrolase